MSKDTNKKATGGMIVSNSGGKDFEYEPDPVIDTERELEGRVIGICHVGIIQKDVWVDGKKTGDVKEVESVMIELEAVEEDTYVERGPEDAKRLEPRKFFLEEKWSSNDRSNFYKYCKMANPASIFKDEKGNDQIDPAKVVGYPLSFKLNKANGKGRQYVNKKEVAGIPAKYQKDVPAAKNGLYLFHADSGLHLGEMSDVNTFFLRTKILQDAVNVEELGAVELIEDYLEELEAAKETNGAGKELEGDSAPAEKPKKARTKKEEPVAEEEPEKEVAEEKPAPRKRARAKKDSAPDYSAMSDEQIEDILVEKGVSDEDLDAISEGADSDEVYKAALIAKLESL